MQTAVVQTVPPPLLLLQPDLKRKLSDSRYNIALENHMYGIPPAFYEKFPELKKWYHQLTTTKDRNGLEYISTIEGIKYPFTGEAGASSSFWL